MFICPIENLWKLVLGTWTQVRPIVSQEFWWDFKLPNWKQAYWQFWLKWHNWIDFAVKEWTPIYAPMDWKIKVVQDDAGYWLHVKIRNENKLLEVILAHLASVVVKDWAICLGDLIWLSGNTGFSSWPHLHMGVRKISLKAWLSIFDLPIQDYENWYKGYYDFIWFMLTWKGKI